MLKQGLGDVHTTKPQTNMDWIVLSMDVESLYPSLQADIVSEIVYKVVVNSDLVIDNLNWRLLSIYLSRKIDANILKEKGLKYIIPKKTKKLSFPLDEEAYEWEKNAEPNQIQIKRMLGLLSKEIIMFIMKNHTYSVGDDIFLQTDGAPIGTDFARVLARLVMIVFDRTFSQKTIEDATWMELLLHLRYIDDENLVVDVINNDNKTKAELESFTASRLQEIANKSSLT